jgi:hypothetical protein
LKFTVFFVFREHILGVVSKFQFDYPQDTEVQKDADGDLVVARKIKDFIEIGK